MENYLHSAAIQVTHGVVINIGDLDDVPTRLAEQIHIASGSPNAWNALDDKKKGKKISAAKRPPNNEAVSAMTPALLATSDPTFEVRNWLEKIRRIFD